MDPMWVAHLVLECRVLYARHPFLSWKLCYRDWFRDGHSGFFGDASPHDAVLIGDSEVEYLRDTAFGLMVSRLMRVGFCDPIVAANHDAELER